MIPCASDADDPDCVTELGNKETRSRLKLQALSKGYGVNEGMLEAEKTKEMKTDELHVAIVEEPSASGDQLLGRKSNQARPPGPPIANEFDFAKRGERTLDGDLALLPASKEAIAGMSKWQLS